jgi:hypothetical protein
MSILKGYSLGSTHIGLNNIPKRDSLMLEIPFRDKSF